VQGAGEPDDCGGDRDAVAFGALACHSRDETLRHFEMFDAQFGDLLGWHQLILTPKNSSHSGKIGVLPLNIQGCGKVSVRKSKVDATHCTLVARRRPCNRATEPGNVTRDFMSSRARAAYVRRVRRRH
jgi:hypothetical protein